MTPHAAPRAALRELGHDAVSRAQQQLRRLLRVVVALRGGRARAKVVVEDLLGGGGGGGGMPNGYYGYVALEGWCGSTVTTFTLRSSGGGACNVDLTLQISILRSDAPSTLPSHTRHTLVTNSSHTRRTLAAHSSHTRHTLVAHSSHTRLTVSSSRLDHRPLDRPRPRARSRRSRGAPRRGRTTRRARTTTVTSSIFRVTVGWSTRGDARSSGGGEIRRWCHTDCCRRRHLSTGLPRSGTGCGAGCHR